jgi:release factor glutamine methyltransferase
VLEPAGPPVPVIACLPHGGRDYPAELTDNLTLSPDSLWSDWLTRELYAFLPALGVTTITTAFSRFVADVNRDPATGQDGGFYASVVSGRMPHGHPVYRRALTPAEVSHRIRLAHEPFHQALDTAVTRLSRRFSRLLLLDLHSFAGNLDGDIILGDRHGATARPQVTALLSAAFARQGLAVRLNERFIGGWTVRRFAGHERVDAVQVELNQRRYLNLEARRFPHPPPVGEFDATQRLLRGALAQVVSSLTADMPPSGSTPAATPAATPSAHSLSAIVTRLRAAGCVFAEDEAQLLSSAAHHPAELAAMVDRRVAGLPLEHVVGWAEFCGLRIAVDPGVFVPRRRTEFLVRQATALRRPGRAGPESRPVVVDLCCGSGALGVAVAAALDPVELHAADLDPAAVRCARRNVVPVGGQVYGGDLFEPLPATLRGRVDLLLANVPYVPTGQIGFLPAEARDYEARVALDGGADGLDVLRRVAEAASRWLAPGGSLLVETSTAQTPAAVAAMARGGLTPRVVTSAELDATVVIGTSTGTGASTVIGTGTAQT